MKMSSRFLLSSPMRYGSSGQCKSIFLSNSPFLSSFYFPCFGTKVVVNCDPREQIQNIKGVGDARNVFDNMSRMRPLPNVIQFNQLLSRVVKLKEYSTAIHLFKDICDLGVSVDEYTMNIAMNSYCLSNRVDFGFSILGGFFKRGCAPDVFTFSTLLKGLFRESKIHEAQELFRKMVKEELCELSVVTYGTVIDGLCKSGNTRTAIEMLRVMEKGRSSCKPNTHIYNMVIDSLCKDRMTDSALKIFDEMSEKEGITPDVVTYNALICGLCNLSRWEEARMLVKKMIDHKISPNVVTLNSLVDALCKEGRVDEAQDVLSIMKQQNVTPNVISYNSLMDGYCLQGRVDEAINVFYSTMSSMNIAPNVWSYSILINGYCRKKKKIDDAMHMFREMPRRGVKPDVATYNTILKGLFSCGRDSCALKLFEEMQAVGLKPDFYTYCTVLDGLCKNDQVERGVLFLDALEHNKGEVHLHIAYYNIVIDCFCKAKKLDAARAVFRDLAAKGLEPSVVTYTILINGCCESGLLMEAKDLLLRMEQEGLLPDEITYNCIIQGNLKCGQYEDAEKLFEQMCAKGFPPDASTIELLLNLLGTKEQNPIIFEMIQKLAPNSL